MKKIINFNLFIRNSLCILLSLYVALWPVSSISQTATLLPNGMQQFFDNNGNPLSSGTVDFYIPNTTTRKNTWQDAAETIVNTNPVLLDGAGRALIYGDGSYRQVLKDSSANLIWDKVVSSYANGTTIITTGDGDQVGTIKPWAGILAPNQYAFANGQEISRTTFAALFTAITQTLNVACTNGNSIITGVSDTTQIPFGAKVELSCVPPGTTVTNKTLTTVTLSAPSNVTLNTTATFFAFGNGNGSTTFNLPDLRGYVVAGRPNMGGTASTNLTAAFFGNTPNATGATGGNQSRTLIVSNLPPYTPSGSVALGFNDPGHTHITPTGVAAASGPVLQALASVSTGNSTTNSSTTGITFSPSFTGVAQGGTSTAFAGIQPTMTLNYIIKITPDTSAQQASGVASLGGMIGAVACGTGIICTGNVIGLVDNPATIPVIHPSSSNLVGTGCSIQHQLWFVDQNLCGSGDTWILNSSDPSALLSIIVGGTVTNGDTVALTFKFGSGPCVAPTGCTATAAVTGASTLTTIAANLVTLIQANANLYNNVAGAQGQILRLSNSAGEIDFDFDSRVPMIVTKTVTGAATETVTIPVSCATACSPGWDVNPTVIMGRLVTGLAPPVNSQIFGLIVQGGSSASPNAFDTQYGVFANTVLSSTTGAVSSRWSMLTPNATGVNNQGIFVGAGLFSPARTDKGNNTSNFSELWTADVNSITRSASTWIFNATTNDKLQFLSGTISTQINNGGIALDISNSAGTTLARLGSAGSSLGQLTLAGNTSGSGTLTPLAAAGASVIWTLPSASGTIAVSATAPLSINATTGALSLSAPWNVTTLTSNGVLYGNSTGTVQATAQGSNRSVFVGNGGIPSFSATPSITSITLDNGLTNGLQFAAASGTNGAVAMGLVGSVLFTLGSAVDAFAVNDHLGNTIFNVAELTPGTLATAVLTFSGTNQSTTTSTGSIQTLGGMGVAKDIVSGGSVYTSTATFMNRSKITFTNNAAAAAGTLTNAPAAGNPTKWIAIDDNGTTRFIPAW